MTLLSLEYFLLNAKNYELVGEPKLLWFEGRSIILLNVLKKRNSSIFFGRVY